MPKMVGIFSWLQVSHFTFSLSMFPLSSGWNQVGGSFLFDLSALSVKFVFCTEMNSATRLIRAFEEERQLPPVWICAVSGTGEVQSVAEHPGFNNFLVLFYLCFLAYLLTFLSLTCSAQATEASRHSAGTANYQSSQHQAQTQFFHSL
jgi:hypothetical protein